MSVLKVGTLEGDSSHDYTIRLSTTGSNPEHLNVAGEFEFGPDAEFVLPSGTTNERPASPATGALRHNTDTNELEVYNGSEWGLVANEEQTGPAAAGLKSGNGSSAAEAAFSATQLKSDFPATASGAYYYYVPGTTDTVQLWTDFEKDGGNWVIISKWGGHSKTVDKIYNSGDYTTSLLTQADFPGYGDYGRLSRDKMNAIWKDSKFVLRIHFKNDQSTNSSGVYFQQKITNVQTFDLWKGHYHSHYWSDWNRSGNDAVGGGTSFSTSFAWANTNPTIASYTTNANFNPTTNAVVGGSGHNAGMGFWDRATVDAPGFGKFEVARHMGLFGDLTIGNQWLFTGNPGENRWGQQENKQSIVLLRW